MHHGVVDRCVGGLSDVRVFQCAQKCVFCLVCPKVSKNIFFIVMYCNKQKNPK